MGRGISVVAIAAWIAALPLSSPLRSDPLPGKWVRVESPNFSVVGNAETDEVVQIAQQLEQVRVLFDQVLPGEPTEGGPRLRVLAARNEGTMKKLLPEYWEVRGGSQPAGVFVSSPSFDQIVLRADLATYGGYSLVFHEYFHFMAREAGWKFPTWASEALATFWGNTTFTKKATEVGRPHQGWIRLLRGGARVPLQQVFEVDRSSAHYRDSVKVQRFYAQSWALLHYLVLGDETGERRVQLEHYLQRVANGEPSLTAARETFGDLDQLQRQVRDYTRKFLFPYVALAPVPALPSDRLVVQDLSKAEASAFVGRFRVERRTSERTRELIERALSGADSLADAHIADARWWTVQGETERAREAFERAVLAKATDPTAHYGLAVLTLATQTSPAAAALAEAQLTTSLTLDPNFAPSKARLASIYHQREPCSPEAIRLIQQAKSLRSEKASYAIREANMLRECGKEAEAYQVLRRLVDEVLDSESPSATNSVCWEGALWGFGDQVLGVCDRAVLLSPESWAIRDSRALARAVAGDAPGAIDDLRQVLHDSRGSWENDKWSQRSHWLQALEQGSNPLDASGLADFRRSEVGIDWDL